MHFSRIFKNKQSRIFWTVIAIMFALGIIAFGAAFQHKQSNTILSIPTLWAFGLIALPILLYLLVVYLSRRRYRAGL